MPHSTIPPQARWLLVHPPKAGRLTSAISIFPAKPAILILETTGVITNNTGNTVNIQMANNHNLTLTGGTGNGSGQISTVTSPLYVALSGSGMLSVTTNNANAYINGTGDLLVNTISTGSGNITLNTNGSLNDTGTPGAIASTGTLTLTSQGAIGNLNGGLHVATGAISITSTAGNDATLVSNQDMTIGTISNGWQQCQRLAGCRQS